MAQSPHDQDSVTPESVYLNRRAFLRTSIYAGSLLATTGLYRAFRPSMTGAAGPANGGEAPTPWEQITHYNNFYEFSTGKEQVAARAAGWVPGPWTVKVDGMVERPREMSLADLARFPAEDRTYRFRCVEGWSMVIPWRGFPLARLLESVRPLAGATHVAFETFYDPRIMQSELAAGIAFPYVEGLRLDEALHPLAILATGLYGKPMPNQNGAPVRLVVPWKYGFKSIKSVVRITVTNQEPPTTWNIANPVEYGFYSNVNPAVDHPRWSQAQERRIGELRLRPTLLFNGYEEVASLYRDLDLRKHF